KNSEKQVRESEANMRTMFDNTDASYVLLDDVFNIVTFNQRAVEGYYKEVGANLSVGANFIETVPENSRKKVRDMYSTVLQGEKLNYEKCYPQKNGQKNWYAMNVFPVFGPDSKVFRMMIATADITERKNIELAGEKMTLDIIQRNKDLEQFAYIISHNLRSPVANIT